MDSFEKFYNSSLKFLSFRARSEKEVRDNLLKKSRKGRKTVEEVDKVIDRIINKLKEQNFINDLEFARLWVEQRTTFKPRSVRLIKIELKQKGISDETISEILGNEDIEKLEKSAVQKLIEKKIKRLNLSDLKDRAKLQRFLASKGFGFEEIRQAIDEVLGK